MRLVVLVWQSGEEVFFDARYRWSKYADVMVLASGALDLSSLLVATVSILTCSCFCSYAFSLTQARIRDAQLSLPSGRYYAYEVSCPANFEGGLHLRCCV